MQKSNSLKENVGGLYDDTNPMEQKIYLPMAYI